MLHLALPPPAALGWSGRDLHTFPRMFGCGFVGIYIRFHVSCGRFLADLLGFIYVRTSVVDGFRFRPNGKPVTKKNKSALRAERAARFLFWRGGPAGPVVFAAFSRFRMAERLLSARRCACFAFCVRH